MDEKNLGKIKIYKAHELNGADFSDFSLNDYRIFLLLISKNNSTNERGIISQTNKKIFELSMKEYADFFKLKVQNGYYAFENFMKKIIAFPFRIKLQDGEKMQTIFIAESAEHLENKSKIRVSFTDDFLPYLQKLKKKYVMYNLADVEDFKTFSSIRLYELLTQFQQQGEIEILLSSLRFFMGVKPDKIIQYGMFKKNFLARAVTEINTNFKLNITFEEIKIVHKVVKIRFKFNKTLTIGIPNGKLFSKRIVRPRRITNG